MGLDPSRTYSSIERYTHREHSIENILLWEVLSFRNRYNLILVLCMKRIFFTNGLIET
jgi:hypothetical protein